MTVKTLRHYHDQGLLIPFAVDGASGYRRYSVDQVPDALLIGRLRRLDMPLPKVRRVLESVDTGQRDAAIADHLLRMEAELGRTRAIVASLRGLLTSAVNLEVQRRSLRDLAAVSVTARVPRDGIDVWCERTFTERYQGLRRAPAGPGGTLYGDEFFTEAVGEVTAYVPVEGGARASPAAGTRSRSMPARSWTSTRPTPLSARTSPPTRPPHLGRSGRSTWSARRTPPTRPATAPRCAGRSPT